MAENRNAFVTMCMSPDEVALLEYAAKELGQTKSTFCYVLVRDRLRQLGLLQAPKPPAMLNGKGAEGVPTNG
jgi:hypothetical protein